MLSRLEHQTLRLLKAELGASPKSRLVIECTNCGNHLLGDNLFGLSWIIAVHNAVRNRGAASSCIQT